MELKIHKSLLDNTSIADMAAHKLLSIDGYKLIGDFSLDNDGYYYFIFERDIDPMYCFDSMEDQHVWNGMATAGQYCRCGAKVWQINYIGPSGESQTSFTERRIP